MRMPQRSRTAMDALRQEIDVVTHAVTQNGYAFQYATGTVSRVHKVLPEGIDKTTRTRVALPYGRHRGLVNGGVRPIL